MPALSWMLAGALAALPPCDLPDLTRSPYEQASKHQVKVLPDGAFGVAMEDPVSESEALLPGNPEAPVPPRPHSKATTWLWSEASGWLLVPVGYQVTRAAVGVDGSWVIEMQGRDNARLRASSTGACVGCALSSGALLFERYAQEARDNEFEFCQGSTQPIHEDQRSDNRVRFHYQIGQRHDAVALIGSEDYGYEELVVSGMEPTLREEILGAFTVE